MKKIGFDNDLYLKLQSKHIQERISQFDNKPVSYTHLIHTAAG